MSPRLLRLAAEMLGGYSATLGNRTCNDWTPPAYLTAEDRAELSRLAWEQNGRQSDESPAAPVQSDFVAADALAHMLECNASAVARLTAAEGLLRAAHRALDPDRWIEAECDDIRDRIEAHLRGGGR